MFSTDFIFRKQENLVDNQKFQAAMQQNTKPLHIFLYTEYLRKVVQ